MARNADQRTLGVGTAKRLEIWIVRLDPVLGSKIGKTRPAVIVSPNEANDALRTVLVASLTSVRRNWPTLLPVTVQGTDADVALDQMRAVDKQRLTKMIASLKRTEAQAVADRLVEMFTA